MRVLGRVLLSILLNFTFGFCLAQSVRLGQLLVVTLLAAQLRELDVSILILMRVDLRQWLRLRLARTYGNYRAGRTRDLCALIRQLARQLVRKQVRHARQLVWQRLHTRQVWRNRLGRAARSCRGGRDVLGLLGLRLRLVLLGRLLRMLLRMLGVQLLKLLELCVLLMRGVRCRSVRRAVWRLSCGSYGRVAKLWVRRVVQNALDIGHEQRIKKVYDAFLVRKIESPVIGDPDALEVHGTGLHNVSTSLALQQAIAPTSSHSSHVQQLRAIDHIIVLSSRNAVASCLHLETRRSLVLPQSRCYARLDSGRCSLSSRVCDGHGRRDRRQVC